MSCLFHHARRAAVFAAISLAAVLPVCAAAPATGATPAADTLALRTQGARTSGPVSVSLQHEINAAVDRGRAWLMAMRNADGSWGSNAPVRLTAVAALALAHDASPDNRAAVSKAAGWLLSPAATNALAAADNLEEAAWREIALQAGAPADPHRTAGFPESFLRHSTTSGYALFTPMLIREAAGANACALLYPAAATSAPPATRILADCVRFMPCPGAAAPLPAATRTLARLASCWSGQGIPLDPAFGTARQHWALAHFINRAGGGTLADGQGRVVDWRHDLARTLVATQKIDPQQQGNGFWRAEAAPADWASHPIAETAFALLALDEL
ncbi:MAG: hypothetical protein WCI17_11605 [bacterium]